MADNRLAEIKGVILIVCLLVLVVALDPITLWFAISLAWTWWGIYSAWWFVVFLFLTVATLGSLVEDEPDPRQANQKKKKWGVF